MSQELTDKFSLNCEVRSNKGKKVIVIKSDSYPYFLKLVDPYIIPEMRYKLPKDGCRLRKRGGKFIIPPLLIGW